MTKHKPFIIILLLIISNGLYAQMPNSSIIKEYHSKIEIGDQTLDQFIQTLNRTANLKPSDLSLVNTQPSANHWEHLKFKQYHNGLEVLGGIYNIHLHHGLVQYANGNLSPNINIKSFKPNLTIQQIQKQLSTYFDHNNAKHYDHSITITNSKLVIVDNLFPRNSGFYSLAYQLGVTIDMPYDKRQLVIDANNGRIIHDQSIICSIHIDGKGKTKYYGEQTFKVDSIEPGKYLLRDEVRNITTYSVRNGELEEYYDDDNYWDLESEYQDEVAIDAHYCTSKFHDMMNNLFQWNGIDGNGLAMDPVIHANQGRPLLNAYWNGENAYFGNGDCHHSPLTTLSVVGHEFMHGITDYTSDLIYSDESGAINESMSDIFGKSLEYFYDNPNFKWELGPEFSITQYASYFRNMADPNAYEDPAYYKGEFWDHFGAVHTNSGVFNYWFYLLIEGKNGINEKGVMYDVQPMPIEDVLQVVWLTQKSYLTPSSNYSDLYTYTLQAATALYGSQSDTYKQMIEAWKACGLPYTNTEPLADLTGVILLEEKSICEEEVPFDLKYQIINIGNQTIPNGDTLFIKVTANPYIDSIFEIVLQNDFLPGDFLELHQDNLFTINESKVYFVNIVILNEDDVADNNYFSEFLRNFVEMEPTMYVTGSTVNIINCFSEDADIEFYIGNFGCQPIPQGTAFNILIKDQEDILVTKEFQVYEDIKSGHRLGFNFSTGGLNDVNEFLFEVTSNEVLTQPNSKNIPIKKTKTITGSYYTSFTDDTFLKELTTNNIYSNYIFDLNGESYLALLGTYQGQTKVPCPETIDNIDVGTHGRTNINACVDLSKIVEPKLSFDLIQFRAEAPEYEDLVENSAVVKVSYFNDEIHESTLIYNEPEGELNNFSFNLPGKFKGQIKLEFFAHKGENDSPNPLNFDANLIDNLTISGISTNEEIPFQNITISPNPSDGVLHIYSNERFSVHQVIDVSGKTVNLAQQSVDKLDISNLISGVYFIQLKLASDQLSTYKFIKI